MNSVVDISVLVNSLVAIVGTVLAAVATMLVNKAIAAFERRTNVQLTDLQRTTVLGAVNTATGLVNVALQKGSLKLDDVQIANPKIAAIAEAALEGVQTSAAALGVTRDGAVNMIVGQVGRALGTSVPELTTASAVVAPLSTVAAIVAAPAPVPVMDAVAPKTGSVPTIKKGIS